MALNTWHKENKTWKKINEFLFKNQTMSDCAFLIEEGTTTVKIPAHKYVLGGYSPEFYSLFYLMKADSDEIPINDVSVENFTKFLEFVYTEKTELSLENVGDLIMLADRYSVESFMDFCGEFLQKSVTVNNALALLDKYSVYQLPNFETQCIKTMRQNRLIFEDPTFYEISNGTLKTILKSEDLKGFKEITIFKGVDKWAEKFCDTNNQVVNSNNKRLALGEALKYIRFGAMTAVEFSSCTLNLDNSILTCKEMVQIFHVISTSDETSCPYSAEKRLNLIKTCNFRLQRHYAKIGLELAGYDVSISFTVNKPIKFHGFGILGRADLSEGQNPEKFNIQLKSNGCILNEDVVEIIHDGTHKIYELLFNNTTLLDANRTYDICIKRQIPGFFLNYIMLKQDMPADHTINMDGIIFNVKILYTYATALIFEEC